MFKTIMLEQFHVTAFAPAGLGKAEIEAMLRTLRSNRFQANLSKSVRGVFRRHSSLKKARFAIDR